jgi:hypothetical protein
LWPKFNALKFYSLKNALRNFSSLPLKYSVLSPVVAVAVVALVAASLLVYHKRKVKAV